MFGGSHRPTAFSWLNLQEDNGERVAGVGGTVVLCRAGLSLNIGDYVYLMNTEAGRVTKSVTAANYNNVRLGIVVGGYRTNMEALQEDNAIGTLAANAEEAVLVCTRGFCKAIAGTAIAGLTNVLGPDTTVAGRVTANNTATRNLGLSQALQPTIGSPVLVYVDPF